MPLFIFISGLFFKDKNVKQKFLSFITIAYICKLVLFITRFILYGHAKFSLFIEPGIPWYMIVLAFYIVITHFLKDIEKKYVLIFFIILACLIGYDSSVRDFLAIARIIVYYPFFLIGQMIDKKEIIKLTNKKSLKLISIIILLIWGGICLFELKHVYLLRILFTAHNPYSINNAFIKWGFIYRIICYIITIVTSFAVINLIPKRESIISKFGERTIQVYFWHIVILDLLVYFNINDLLIKTPVGKIVWLFCAVVVAILLSLKPFGKPIDKIMSIFNNNNSMKRR